MTPSASLNYQAHNASAAQMLRSLWANRQLIRHMVVRDIASRYQGSMLGLLWSALNPLFMLAVYTFVFSVVFKARWGVTQDQPTTSFALILFVGLIVHALFAEVANRAPNQIIANPNYVTRVIFPLEILPFVAMCTALFQAAVSVVVLLLAMLVIQGSIAPTVVLLPLVLVPLLPLTLGVGWLLCSLGVYLRDVGQTVAILTTVMLFLSPVFFPVDALPEAYRPWIRMNPLTMIIEQAREVLIWGNAPDWLALGGYLAVALLIAWLGFAWFQKTRHGFADVL